MKGEHRDGGGQHQGRSPAFREYCALCGWALALAHAKSGDAASISGYCGKSAALDEALARFSLAYARQTEQDHERSTRPAAAAASVSPRNN